MKYIYISSLLFSLSTNFWHHTMITLLAHHSRGSTDDRQVTSCGFWIWTPTLQRTLPAGGRWSRVLVPVAASIMWPCWILRGACGFTTVTWAGRIMLNPMMAMAQWLGVMSHS